MNIKPIRTKKDYNNAINRLKELWDAKNRAPESDEPDVLATPIDK